MGTEIINIAFNSGQTLYFHSRVSWSGSRNLDAGQHGGHESMTDAFSLGSVIISAVSLVVSVVAAWKSLQAQREANIAQRRIVEIEEQREQERRLTASQAFLSPQLRKTERGSYRLYLVNSGKAEARNVRVKLDGVPLGEHPVAVEGDNLPVRVGPNSEVSCILAITLSCAPPFEIEVMWEDDSGTDRVYRGTLTF